MTITSDQVSPEQVLVEIEDALRTVPPRATVRPPTSENFEWRGRAAAAVQQWNAAEAIAFDRHLSLLDGVGAHQGSQSYAAIMVTLNKARSDLRMRLTGPKNIAIGQGQVFDYFDELRKVIEPARQDVLFIDRYLNADFVARYMPHIHTDAAVRLLTTTKASQKLLPAIDAYCVQNGLNVAVRTSDAAHDRYVFIDRAQCYQSGASFKDGAKQSPTTIMQVTDAFSAVLKTYEDIWSAATVVR